MNAQSPAYRHFTDEDGLPSMTVYGIKEDPQGYLWMNTTKGICRFDGKEFKKYEVPDLKGQDIPYFFMDDEGTPWFYNLAGEIVYIKDDKIKRILAKSPSIDLVIISFYANRDNIYITWFSNNQSISIQYDRKDINKFKQLPNAYGFIGLHNNNILAAKKALRDYCFELYSIPDNKLLFDLSYFQNKYFNYDNEIYLGSELSTDSLVLFTPYFCGILNSKYELLKTISLRNIIGEKILYLSLINDNNLFIKTSDHSIIYNIITGKTVIENQIKTAINTIMEDRYSRRWISTTNNGLYLSFLGKVMVYNNTNSNINTNEISCLKEDFPLLINGHSNGDLSVLNQLNNSWNIIHTPGMRRIKTILKMNANKYIIGSDIGIYELSTMNNLKSKINLLKEFSIKDILLLNPSHFIIMTSNGTYSCSYNQLKDVNYIFSEKDIVINMRSTTACKYKDSIIVGTIRGMYIQNGKKYDIWHPLVDRKLYINKLYNQNDNVLWICTDGNGVYAYKEGRIIDSLNTSNGLPSNSVACITAIDKDRVVFGTDNGAFVYDITQQKGFGFNQLDGLPGKEILDICYSNGAVWFGTTKGLASVPIDQLQPNQEKPLITISSAMAFTNGGETKFSNELPYNSNHLRFVIQTRSLLSENQLKILYKLSDTDSTWITANSKILEFVGLAPGKYNLQIKAINEDGVSSETSVNLAFVINPPWWKTLWFNLLVICSLVSGSIGITYWRQIKRRKEEDKKRLIVEQMNQLRQQALQNQMNPHFIFNSLNAIQNFLLVNDEVNAVNYMSKFGKLIRMIFEQSKMKFISLEEEIDLLKHYIHLEELRFGNKVEVTFKIDPDLIANASEITIPPLLIQPIIENSFRHGLFHLEKDGFLSINMFKQENDIICIIEDNGIGRDRSKKINEWKNKTHKSSGIKSTFERLEILDNGRNKLGLEIIDLIDHSGKPTGTKAILKL